MGFQENLRYYREQAGYSSIKLAKILQIPYTTYKNYENMRNEPKYETLIKIADVLNVSTDKLLGRSTLLPEKELISAEEAMKSAENIKRYCDTNCCKCVFSKKTFRVMYATVPSNLPPKEVLRYLQNNIEEFHVRESITCVLRGEYFPENWELEGCAKCFVSIKQKRKS